jgi:hypothetical protein
MYKTLSVIREKIESIGYGLLRVSDEDEQQVMRISPSFTNTDSLNCIINCDDSSKSLLNRKVRIIQKQENDYLYISGLINDEVENNCKVVSLKIIKACWFIKKKRGSVVWLQEKYMYETTREKIEKAS